MGLANISLMCLLELLLYKSLNKNNTCMKEKILAALKTKFVGVDDAILSRIAEKKAIGVADESQIPTIIEGVGFQDVVTSYGDFRAGDASNSAVKNYEKKHNLKDGKTLEEPGKEPNKEPDKEPNPNDMATIIANAVNAAVKPLSDKLSILESEKSQATRNDQIMAKAKEYGIPESQAKRYAIPEDADLDTYFKDAKQDLANVGFQGVNPPESPEATVEKESTEIAKLINKGTEEIVEQIKK